MNSLPEIEFDEATHTYTLAGRVLPSVSAILKAGGLMPDFYRNLDPWYAERGKLAHLACHYDDTGELDDSTVDPRILPRVEAWRAFKKQFDVKVRASEVIVHNRVVAGTLDKIVDMFGSRWVLDIKLSSPELFHPVQTMAYKLLDGEATLKRGCVYLKKDGKFSFKPHEDDLADTAKWLEAVAAYGRSA